jgi:hypothetical protein
MLSTAWRRSPGKNRLTLRFRPGIVRPPDPLRTNLTHDNDTSAGTTNGVDEITGLQETTMKTENKTREVLLSEGWRNRRFSKSPRQHRHESITVIFSDQAALETHLNNIIKYIAHSYTGTDYEAENSVLSALAYLGFDTYVRATSGFAAWSGDTEIIGVRPLTGNIEKPEDVPDFFDLLRKLNQTMRDLAKEIRAISDPNRISPEIKVVRAYLDSFSHFLEARTEDTSDTMQDDTPEVPAAIPHGLFERIRKINWLKVSENAQRRAETITNILVKILR